jgi:haloalkane dehalogenase
MRVLRTPEARFAALPDFPYAPRYVDLPDFDGGTLRMAYIDEGPRDAEVVLLLHGEPSWSFLYRKVIAALTTAGLRAVAPDLIGFGRSDKPAAREDYSYQRHVDWLRAFLLATALPPSPWSARTGAACSACVWQAKSRAGSSASSPPIPSCRRGTSAPPEAFFTWRDFSQNVPELPIGGILKMGSARELLPEVLAAYDAPFPDESYKAGARAFPALVPATPDDPASPANRRAWQSLERYDKPFLTAFGDSDPITRGGDLVLQRRIPGAAGQPHTTLERAGHFLQEDAGEELGRLIADFMRKTPRP